MDRQVPSSALQARRRRDREGAGALMRPGAEGRITPKDKSSDFRNGWADSTFAASPASCPQLLIRDPGQGGAKSRELRIDGVLGSWPRKSRISPIWGMRRVASTCYLDCVV